MCVCVCERESQLCVFKRFSSTGSLDSDCVARSPVWGIRWNRPHSALCCRESGRTISERCSSLSLLVRQFRGVSFKITRLFESVSGQVP